jgi:hypothetical protein
MAHPSNMASGLTERTLRYRVEVGQRLVSVAKSVPHSTASPGRRVTHWALLMQYAGRYHSFAHETSQFEPSDRLSLWVSRKFPQALLAKFGIIVKFEYDPFLEQLLQFFITAIVLPFSATYSN